MKPPLRTKSVGTKVSEAEFALLEERARGAGMRLAEWVREALLAAPVEPVAGSGVDSGEVALGEILALRSLLLNLHFRAAAVIAFVAVQLVGIACSWFWEHPYSGGSSFLWGTGLLALFPGNLLGTWAVQSLLWHSRLTLGAMSMIAIVLGVAINAAVWFVVVKVFQSIFRRRSRAKPSRA